MGLHETDYARTQDGTAALADVGGAAVHIGARIAASAGGSEVLVSSTVKDLTAGSGLIFEDAGEHELKGVPDRWRLFRVTS
jgi:class 3 adenylate cyclase